MVRLFMVNICSILFWNMIVSGIFISLGSLSWMGVWIGMEVSLLGVYGMFCGGFTQSEVMCSLKYLLIQVLSASIILVGFLSRDWVTMGSVYGGMLMNLGVFMKIGVFPFYYWVPSVMEGLSWKSGLVFCTLQKVVPLMVFCVVLEVFTVMNDVCALISILVAGFEGIRQVSIRGIFAYSSIGQSGWLLFFCGRGDTSGVIWFSVIYSFVLMSVFFSFLKYDPFSYGFMKSGNFMSSVLKMYNSMVVFSLMGLPPLLGFIPKILVLSSVGFSLGGFSLGFLWSIIISVWFYVSFLFAWVAESYSNLYYFKCISFKFLMSEFLFLLSGFFVNLWGGVFYFFF